MQKIRSPHPFRLLRLQQYPLLLPHIANMALNCRTILLHHPEFPLHFCKLPGIRQKPKSFGSDAVDHRAFLLRKQRRISLRPDAKKPRRSFFVADSERFDVNEIKMILEIFPVKPFSVFHASGGFVVPGSVNRQSDAIVPNEADPCDVHKTLNHLPDHV
ncbi:hypothetical protein D3C76_475500 [compost metagenome]